MCITLPYSSKVGHSIQRGKLHFLNNPTIILYDNARAHAAGAVTDVLNCWDWEVLYHPTYSLDLIPCDYDVIPKMKEPLRGARFRTVHDIIHATDCCLHNIQRLGSANGIQWLPQCWEHVILNGGGYIASMLCM